MKNRYLYEYLRSPIPIFIFVFTIIVSYIDGPAMSIRNSFGDFIMYELSSRLLFQFAIFMIWSLFWFNKFQDDTLLVEIRHTSYFDYIKDKLKAILYLSISTVFITLLGILIGGLFYRVFDFHGFLPEAVEVPPEGLAFSAFAKDMFGEIVIPLAILYSILGFFFLGVLYFYIINSLGRELSRIILFILLILTVQMLLVGDMSFYFEPFQYIWFIYPNYYISFPYVISTKGVYSCLFIVALEVIFTTCFILKVKREGIKWIRR